MIKTEDNGGLRSHENRRVDTLPIDFPDRRTETDRRTILDRRSGQDRRSPKGFRAMTGQDRRGAWTTMSKFSQHSHASPN